nr:ABC transporter permease [uncultured Desulfobacter sp.]
MLHGYGLSLLLGGWVTVKLTLWSLGIGLVLGLIGAVGMRSSFRAVRIVCDGVTTIIRGIPELLFVLGIYLGSSVLLNDIASRLGYRDYIEIDAFTAGVMTLSVVFGAYATEVFRGAIQAVDKGQIEAAHAFGMGRITTYRRIILPQMWRIALPGIGNLFMVLLKNTALLSVIGVQELMRNAASAVGYTKEPFTFYLAACVIYLVLTSVSMIGLEWLERRANRGYQRG